MTYFVNIYAEGRAFGGHEEGGWYYDYRDARTSFQVEDEEKANQLADLVRDRIGTATLDILRPKLNQMGYGPHDGADPDGNGDDDYLIRGGRWGDEKIIVKVEEQKGEDYPETLPPYDSLDDLYQLPIFSTET